MLTSRVGIMCGPGLKPTTVTRHKPMRRIAGFLLAHATSSLTTIICLLLVSAGCSTGGRIRDVEPRADDILRQMSDTLVQASAFRFTASTTRDQRLENGPIVERESEHVVTLRRPNKLHAISRGDGDRQVWYDGRILTVLDARTNRYANIAASDTIDEMLDDAMDDYDLEMPLADLLSSDPYEMMIDHVDSGEYVGLHQVDGRACHHLVFRQAEIDWQIWIDAEPPALPRKLLITFRSPPDHPRIEAILTRWDLSPRLRNDLFEFRPTAGAVRVKMKSLMEARGGGS